MTSLAQFNLKELGGRPHSQKVDEALTRQPGEDLQRDGTQSGSEGFTPWASEPDEDVQSELLYTAEDLAEAVDEARRIASSETEVALRQAFANDIDQRRCELIAAMRDQLEQQKAAFDDILGAYALISQRLAAALAKAVIPRALERSPLSDISEILRATLARLAAEPAIEVRFSPAEADLGEAILADIARDAGLSAEVKSIADPVVIDGGVEIRWRGGVVDHGWQVLYAEALSMIDHWLGEDPGSAGVDVQMTGAARSDADLSFDDSGAVDDPSLGTERADA